MDDADYKGSVEAIAIDLDMTNLVATPAVSAESSEESAPEVSQTSNSTSGTSSTISDDVEAVALSVIRGTYGNGQERINSLGSQYKEIQKRVNELKRQGAF